jgi:hypothetical protein
MTRPVITALPPAPTRGEDAATFAAKANTFVAALPAYGTESNAVAAFVEDEADAAQASRIAAEAAETGAEAAETAAQAAQAAAEAASNATEWVSGQAYDEGDVVWSPINYLSYRANTNTSGTTDPSLSASWTSLGVPLPVSIANGGTGTTSTTFANLTTNVTGTLPVANGGTGATSLTSGSYLKGNGTSAIAVQAGIPAGDITSGTLGVARGGTGATTLTANNVILGNGTSAVQFVAPGTTGNVLTSNGTTWTSASGSPAGWTLLSTVTASNSATADVETTFNSTYDEYAILCTSVVAPSNGVSFLCRLKIGGTYQTDSYRYHLHNSDSGGTTYIAQASAGTDSSIMLAVNIGNTTGMSGDFTISISNPTSTSLTSLVRSSGAFMHSSGAIRLATGAGCRTASQAALTGVRFLFDSGNIISGTFRLYGIRK